MVAVHARQNGPFSFSTGYQFTGLSAPDGTAIPADKEDVLALVRNQLATANFDEDGIAVVAIDLPAYHAARSGFGLPKERRLLESLYVATDVSRPHLVMFDDLSKSSGLTDNETRTYGIRLSQKGLAIMTRGGLQLTGEGIASVEEPEPEPQITAMPIPQTTYNLSGNIGAAQFGDGNSANVVQNVNPNLAEVAKLLTACREVVSQLPLEVQQDANEHLDDVEQELKLPKPKASRLSASIAWLAGHGAQVGAWASNIAALGKWIHEHRLHP